MSSIDDSLDKKETEEHGGYEHLFGPVRKALFVALTCSAMSVGQAGVGLNLAISGYVSQSMGGLNTNERSWTMAAYSLTIGTFILIAGRMGDRFGSKSMFLCGYGWYGFCTLMTGLSVFVNSQVYYDIFRAMEGIGPAFMIPNALALLGMTFPQGHRRSFVLALFGAVAPGGATMGAVFGALFGELVWWPWVFWGMAITCTTAVVIGIFVIPPELNHGSKVGLDIWGSITGVSGLIMFNFAWNEGSVVGWSVPYVYILFIFGCIFIGIFFFIESRVSDPLLPQELMNRRMAFVLSCIACGWGSFGVWIFYFWRFSLQSRGNQPLLVAAEMSPVTISGITAAFLTWYLMPRMDTGILLLKAMVAFNVGLILIATTPVAQTYWLQTFFSVIITPFGMDMSFPAGSIMVSHAVSHKRQGVAASVLNTVVNYSVSIGLGMAGLVESSVAPSDSLQGFRGAFYFGIGLSGLGVCIAAMRLVYTRLWNKDK